MKIFEENESEGGSAGEDREDVISLGENESKLSMRGKGGVDCYTTASLQKMNTISVNKVKKRFKLYRIGKHERFEQNLKKMKKLGTFMDYSDIFKSSNP